MVFQELEEIVAMDKNISKVYEEIKDLLSDEEVLAIAEAREKQFLDYNSAINHVQRQTKLETAKAFLDLADDESITNRLDLPLEVE